MISDDWWKADPGKSLILAAAQDQHSLGAVLKAWKEGIIEPILVGNRESIQKYLCIK